MPKKVTLKRRVNRLESISRPEVKHLGADNSNFQIVGSNNGTLVTPQKLEQGTARNQRVGDKVKSRNIRFQAIFKMPSIPAAPTCAIRIVVLRSKMTHATTSNMMSNWYSTVDEDKFFVVKDILTQVSLLGVTDYDGSTTQSGSTLKKIKFNIPCGLRKLQYDGAGGGSDPDGRPLNNEILVFMFAENSSAKVSYNYQHYYLDN